MKESEDFTNLRNSTILDTSNQYYTHNALNTKRGDLESSPNVYSNGNKDFKFF